MITFVKGDATRPQGDGFKIIAHCCNDVGAYGAGFALALKEAHPFAAEAYFKWFELKEAAKIHPLYNNEVVVSGDFKLGMVEMVRVSEELFVANIIGQHGVGRTPDGKPPIRYDAIQAGLKSVFTFAQIFEATLHMPRMGAGLAGGNWVAIEKLIRHELSDKGISVTVYDLPV